jgi:hypothetical protein
MKFALVAVQYLAQLTLDLIEVKVLGLDLIAQVVLWFQVPPSLVTTCPVSVDPDTRSIKQNAHVKGETGFGSCKSCSEPFSAPSSSWYFILRIATLVLLVRMLLPSLHRSTRLKYAKKRHRQHSSTQRESSSGFSYQASWENRCIGWERTPRSAYSQTINSSQCIHPSPRHRKQTRNRTTYRSSSKP